MPNDLSDTQKRGNRHNNYGGRSTRHGVPWKLVWHKTCESTSHAKKLKLKIKKRGAGRFLNDLENKL